MCKIAVVDDHHILLDGLKWVISQYSFVSEVDAYYSAESLLAGMELGLRYDMVVTDLQMPGKNGHELIEDLKKDYPDTKILVMTMFDSPYVVKKVMNSKAHGFFIKQGDQNHLEEAMRVVLDGGIYWPNEMSEIETVKLQSEVNITKREVEIINLIANEHNSRMIAEKLFISEDTVLTHRKNIMQKLDIHSTAGLVAFAIKNNLV